MMKRYYADGVRSRHAAELELFKRNRHNWVVLRKKRVLVAGAGGLGNFILAGLVGTGVKEVHVVDPDVVELHNLNRQFLFSLDDVGRKKAKVIEEKMSRGPATVRGIVGRVEEVDIGEYDLVFDCLDDWDAKMALIERGSREGVPVVFMSVGRGVGMVSVPSRPFKFKPRRGCIVSTPEIMVTAGIGLSEGLRILEGKEPLLRDRLLVVDIDLLSFNVFEI